MAIKEIEFTKCTRIADVFAECNADYVLPDYNSDIRKILLFTASAYPSSVFPDGEYLECSGNVTFNLVYLDFEGEVSSTSFGSDYQFKIKCNTENYISSVIDTKASTTAIRLLSPRKISAKAGLESSINVLSKDCRFTEGTLFEDVFEPQLEEKSLNIRDVKVSEVFEREYAESVARFDGKTTDEIAVLYTFVEPTVESIEITQSGINVKGRLFATMLMKTDDTPLYRLEKAFVIDETIASEELSENADVKAKINISSQSAVVRGDENGTDVILNIIAEIRLIGEENKSVVVITDAYSCSSECECVYDSFDWTEYIKQVNTKHEYTTKKSVSELELENPREVVFTSAVPKIESVYLSENTAVVDGEIRFSAVISEMKDNEDIEYTSVKFNSKFSENVNLNCQINSKNRIVSDLIITDVFGEVDSDNVCVKANITSNITVLSDEKCEVLTSANAGENISNKNDKARVTVYYPESNDTLFSVAKRFHTTKEKIFLDNSFGAAQVSLDNSSVLSGVKRIIIT